MGFCREENDGQIRVNISYMVSEGKAIYVWQHHIEQAYARRKAAYQFRYFRTVFFMQHVVAFKLQCIFYNSGQVGFVFYVQDLFFHK
jgi:hypothetical protein